MAEIDLKAVTPDTSLPTTGFLFGADSQSAANPSAYSAAGVLSTLLGAAAFTGETVTTSKPLIDMAQTWNAGGVTFTGLKANFTDTASASASKLLDLQIGGSSKLSVGKTGALTIGGSTGSGSYDPLIKLAAWTSAEIYIGTTPNCFADLAVHGGNSVVTVGRNAALGFSSSSADSDGGDVFIRRDAANVLAQRNGATAQTKRIYATYTDGSNYERLSITGSSIVVETAGTGADNIDLTLTPAGTGVLKFGSHSAIAAETVTGYITIKDSGGTTRKLAVVS